VCGDYAQKHLRSTFHRFTTWAQEVKTPWIEEHGTKKSLDWFFINEIVLA
jgi:hypothetical protein